MSKIIIVDDDPKTIKLLTLYMAPLGCDIVSCSDGIKALELTLALEPDLVIIDALLPRLDGFSLIRKIKESNMSKYPAIILMTAIFKREKYKIEALDAGADIVIYKPFKKNEIIEKVESLLSKKKTL